MEEIDWESRNDDVNREDIWKTEAGKWIDTFKSEETPIEKRITDYMISGWSVKYNTEEKISVHFQFEVTPVDENNTAWENPHRCQGYIDMVNKGGEYVVEYLSDIPKDYDKFLEEFEEWKKTNSQTETVVSQGENINLNSAQEEQINKLSTGIISVCAIVLVVMAVLVVLRVIKHKK